MHVYILNYPPACPPSLFPVARLSPQKALLYNCTANTNPHCLHIPRHIQGRAKTLTLPQALLSPEFPESHGSCGCDVQRIHIVRHGNAHHVIGGSYRVGRKSVTLRAHYYGELGDGLKFRSVDRNRFISQSHCRRAESVPGKRLNRFVQHCPRHEKHRPH